MGFSVLLKHESLLMEKELVSQYCLEQGDQVAHVYSVASLNENCGAIREKLVGEGNLVVCIYPG